MNESKMELVRIINEQLQPETIETIMKKEAAC